MRYGILADVHSNLEALEAVLAYLNTERLDRFLCAGDLVGYGADPSACMRRLRDNGVEAVCGNHDRAAAGRMDLDWFDPPARTAAEWTARRLAPEEKAVLTGLPLVWRDGQVTVVHASLEEPEGFHYVLDMASAQRSLDLQDTPVAFIGHTHVPGFFVEEGGSVRFRRAERIQLPKGSKVLVNAGSVGQPRDGDPRAACCVYDADRQTVEIRRVPYSVEKTQAKILAAGLPEFLATRLEMGY